MSAAPSKPSTPRTWVLPAVIGVAVLALLLFGRDIIAGLFGFLAVAFAVALVVMLVALVLAMARPGPVGALHGLPRTPGEARELFTQGWFTLKHTFGQAPWRQPATVARTIQRALPKQVAEMASGNVAYGHLWIGVHPDTLRRVDQWLPVEDLAWLCAQQYANAHPTTNHMSTDVSVAIAANPDTPRGRHTIIGGFRPVRAESDRWAVARCDYPAGGTPARPEGHTVLRLQADQLPEPEPHDDGEPVNDGLTSLEPDSTMRMSAAGPRPAGAPDDITFPMSDPPEPAPPTRPMTNPLDTPPITLTPLAGGNAESRARTFPNGPVVIGRATGATWHIDDPYVSRTHAELRINNGRWTIVDRDSSHGTFVNGMPLRDSTPRTLRDGDVITFGRGKDHAATFNVALPS